MFIYNQARGFHILFPDKGEKYIKEREKERAERGRER
jgi:hypothetical protein